METHRLHAGQLCQRATEMQKARVRALLSWGQTEGPRSVKEGRRKGRYILRARKGERLQQVFNFLPHFL